MTTDLRNRFLSAVIFFILIASAMFTVPARADSGSPPPVPEPTGDSSASTATTSTVSQVPTAVTNVAGGDSGGHKVKLDSQKAAYVAAAGDPVWCPSSMGAPTPGAGACTINEPDIATLVTYLGGHLKTVDGTIWIDEGGSDASGLAIDGGGGFATMAAHQLTFKGGWTGIGGGINPSNPSVFTNTLDIMMWNNNVTLSNITIQNSSGDGLDISTTKNISLTGFTAFHNGGYGAYLDNTWGTGSVTISKSSFNQNDITSAFWGLSVTSHGAISLTGVSADQNSFANGAKLDNCIFTGSACVTVTASPVTIVSSEFSNNNTGSYSGLNVDSNGAITFKDVTANNNGSAGIGYGAKLDNCNLNLICTTHGKSVTLSGTNIFDANSQYGLNILTSGAITSGSLDANLNGSYGAHLDNQNAFTPLPITFTGTSSFSNNGSAEGLDLYSRGAITTNNLTAYGNGAWGVSILSDLSSTAPELVTMKGTNWFVNNGHSGLLVTTYGAITLNNINANGNGYLGSYDGLSANIILGATIPHAITLTGTNNFDLNTNNGAELVATGTVSVSNATAYSNTTGTGLTIVNTSLGSTKPQPVTITGNNVFSYNHKDGLVVVSYGKITISNLSALNNGTANGNNGVTLVNSGGTPHAVTLTGTNVFNTNYSNGLLIDSMGIITVSNLSAFSNGHITGDTGAVLVNSTGPAQSVTLTGTNSFNSNYGAGLEILSSGRIAVSNLSASSNGHSTGNPGAVLINDGTTAQAVTLTGSSTFSLNYGDGLDIISHGKISLSNLNVFSNGHAASNIGASLINTGGTAQAVVLTGTNTFNANYGDGLDIFSFGTVTSSNLNADGNGHISGNYGVDINNSNAPSAQSVTLTGTNFFDFNYGKGLGILSKGTITVGNLNASSNTNSDGASLANYVGTAGVTVTGTNVFNTNGGDGLDIETYGAITVNNVTANYNTNGDGADFNNTNPSHLARSITMKGVNTFNNNSFGGIYLKSDGAITTNNVTANNNSAGFGYHGANFDNCDLSGTCQGHGNITMLGFNVFMDNATGFSDGLHLITNGNVSVTHITADYNDNNGMYVENTGGTVTVTCGTFIGNGWDSGNGYGIQEDNTLGTPSHTYLTGVDAAGNTYSLLSGLYNVTTNVRTCTLP